MKFGFTTGSCAAAAAKAACQMLFSKTKVETVKLITPKQIEYNAEIEQIERGVDFVSCCVRKDGGDDPDITTGILIGARVSFLSGEKGIWIDGGAGVGRVTKPGLDQPVGAAAINSTPRAMIKEEVERVCAQFQYEEGISICIFAKGGEEIAKQTFNPRLGIVGGISILGTSGIVEPMSTKALLDTISVELDQRRALGENYVVIAPGNYGVDFIRQTYGYDLDLAVKCSNFIGETLDRIKEKGFFGLLLVGHIGKLVKVSGGIMNTHSKEADCRMELLASAALYAGVKGELCRKILDCVSTDAALALLTEQERSAVMDRLMTQIMYYLHKRMMGHVAVECIVFSNECGLLGKSNGADALMEKILFEVKDGSEKE